MSSLDTNKYLIGPSSLIKMTKIGSSKTIYLIGDFHEKTSKCPENVTNNDKILFQDLLVNELKQNPTNLIDLFVEASYINKLYPKTKYTYVDSYMIDVITHFKKCLELSKESCAHNNLRVHYVDVRAYGNIQVTLLKVMYMVTTSLLKDQDKLAQYSWNSLTKELDEEKTNPLEVLDNLINMQNIYDVTKITKQLENINPLYNEVRQRLTDILYYTNKEYVDNKAILRQYIQELNQNSFTDMDKKYLNYVWNILNNITVRLMDVYLLARIFRTFKSYDNKDKNIPELYKNPPDNIIIYAGQYHIDFYKRFLTDVGFNINLELLSNQKDINYQCIALEKLTLPLFQTRKKIIRKHIPVTTS